MNPALISFGIQSVIRLGRVTNDALDQWARDGEAILPEINEPNFNREVFVNGFFNKPENNPFVVGDAAQYAEYWDDPAVKPDKTAIDALFTAAIKIGGEQEVDVNRGLAPGGAILIKQWDPAQSPLSPWARIILSAGDIALEYVAVNPSILDGDGNGQKLISAYAKNLSDILPDDGSFGVKENFAQRLTGAFLRAGLETISQNHELLVSEKHLQELISSSVKPLVQALPNSITEQLKWGEIADAIMGPAASAALQTVARHQTAFLGEDFDPNRALGAVTQALFLEAAGNGLRDKLTPEGLLGLYRAALGVAAERPQLFLGDGQCPQDEFARELFSKFADVLSESPPPFDGEVGIALASAALGAVGNNIHRFVDDSDPWEQTAAEMVSFLTTKFKNALDTNENLGSVFSKSQLIELGRTLLSRVAETPEMILGSGNQAWEGVLTAVATAMKEDTNLLLTGDDWLEIAKVAAEEAATNPVRLFRLNPANPGDVLAAKLISVILKSAGAIIETPELQGKTVLFGKTLREAIIIVLRATSGNSQAAQEHLEKIEKLTTNLNGFVATNHLQYGNKEWLRLFRILLSPLLEGKGIPDLTAETANELLQGGS
ncbi:MAG: hypothetical protein JSU72_01720 [Deltaproteobacteria bacterium]|nr:MAG: hypothetical protein JSU72_01720 [Deltaproteobacteria bacterium]